MIDRPPTTKSKITYALPHTQQNQGHNGIKTASPPGKMNSARFLTFLPIIFCLVLASPVSPAASVAHRRDPTKRVDVAPVVTTDEVRLCSGVVGTGYEYGDQNNQSSLAFDCKQLANETKILADKQGNFSEPCNAGATEFALFAGYGDCTMWFECPSSTDSIAK